MQTVGIGRFFGQLPGRRVINIFVGAGYKTPYRFDGVIDFQLIHMFLIRNQCGFCQFDQIRIHIQGYGRAVFQFAVVIFFHHADRTVQQVAQIVGQVCVDTVDESVAAEVTVTAQIDFPQQEITDCVCSEFVNQAVWVNHVADGLAHLGAVHYQPAVTIHFFRDFFFHGHQHDRPDDGMETHDLLAHQMDICRPVFFEHFFIRFITDGSHVVQQGVKPYIDYMLGIEGRLDTPVKGSAGYAQIFQSLLDKVDHLVAAGHRLDKIRMLVNVLQHAVRILAHLEEIAFFLHLFYGTAAVRAVAVYQLMLGPEGFAGHTVPAFIVFLVNVTFIINLLHHGLHHFFVAFLGGAKKIIVGNFQPFPQALEGSHDFIYIFNGRNPQVFRLTLNLLAVLIAAGEEKDIFPFGPVIAGNGIRHRGAVSMTDVQFFTGIINRRGNKKRFLFFVFHDKPFFLLYSMSALQNCYLNFVKRFNS